MNELTKRERELVAIGAAMGSNCASCIEFHIPEARSAGVTDAQIQEAIELADAVRTVSARNAAKAQGRGDRSAVVTNCWHRIRYALSAYRPARRYGAAALTSLDLKDLGLYRSDRPAIASGLLIQDTSRRQR